VSVPDLRTRVLFEDAHVIVLDKPAGLPVHGGPKAGASVEDQLDALAFGFKRRPQLAHRLDRDTSGCLVLGRHPRALAKLGGLFSGGGVEKVYWAVVTGGPASDTGTIDLALAKQTRRDGWWMTVDPKAGQAARTDWRVLGRSGGPHPVSLSRRGRGDGTSDPQMIPSPAAREREGPAAKPWEGEGLTWVEMRPRTGRTHQVRVHAAAFGWPILGDPVYADPAPGVPLHLHARSVTIPYSEGRPPIAVTAPVPSHLRTALSACGWPGEE
jgi:tRNA pseudouridine32 synthase / 23S rRNA pseudouridine746 synthase